MSNENNDPQATKLLYFCLIPLMLLLLALPFFLNHTNNGNMEENKSGIPEDILPKPVDTNAATLKSPIATEKKIDIQKEEEEKEEIENEVREMFKKRAQEKKQQEERTKEFLQKQAEAEAAAAKAARKAAWDNQTAVLNQVRGERRAEEQRRAEQEAIIKAAEEARIMEEQMERERMLMQHQMELEKARASAPVIINETTSKATIKIED